MKLNDLPRIDAALAPQAISTDVLLEKYAKGTESSAEDIHHRVSIALAAVEEPEHRFVERAVGLGVEVLGPKDLDHAREGVSALQEQGAQDRAFGVEVVGRYPGRKVGQLLPDHVDA